MFIIDSAYDEGFLKVIFSLVQECLTVQEPVKGKHCLAMVLPDIEALFAR